MFVDTAKVFVAAGKGGNGAISFRHEIYIPKGGPDGGDGGRGGSVIFEATTRENTLINFRFQPRLIAKDGANGSGQRSSGKSGEDLIVKVPVGTIVKRGGKVIADLINDGQQEVIAQGGEGGRGNWHFKSSTRQTPRFAELGTAGESFEVELELKLIADVGLLGFPNAGKSTFLSVVTAAKPEIANYPFTTLTPHLGVAKIDNSEILIADIPGIIDGAADGKGLGLAFLRHVERCKVLLHLVDIYSDDAGESYQKIRTELEKYSAELVKRPEVVALTKVDGVDQDIVDMQIRSIKKFNPDVDVLAISSVAHQGLTPLLRKLKEVIKEANDSNNLGAKNENDIPVISLPDTKVRQKHARYEMRDNTPVELEISGNDEAEDDNV
ncbi:GTPase ObgE [Candidatus Saccharibacteria bacterium]|nr:GTPase ObgE [Candidatus Saccharibacteria bacterium]